MKIRTGPKSRIAIALLLANDLLLVIGFFSERRWPWILLGGLAVLDLALSVWALFCLNQDNSIAAP